jgi:hypothetical protein
LVQIAAIVGICGHCPKYPTAPHPRDPWHPTCIIIASHMPATCLDLRNGATKSVRQKANKINYLTKIVAWKCKKLSLFAIFALAAIVTMQQNQQFARIS